MFRVLEKRGQKMSFSPTACIWSQKVQGTPSPRFGFFARGSWRHRASLGPKRWGDRTMCFFLDLGIGKGSCTRRGLHGRLPRTQRAINAVPTPRGGRLNLGCYSGLSKLDTWPAESVRGFTPGTILAKGPLASAPKKKGKGGCPRHKCYPPPAKSESVLLSADS